MATEKIIVDKTIKGGKEVEKAQKQTKAQAQAQEPTPEIKEKAKPERLTREIVDYESKSYGINEFTQFVKERLETEFDGLTNHMMSRFVHQVFYTLDDLMACDAEVSIVGFGKFFTKERPARIKRNIATGKRVLVQPDTVIRFSPSIKYVGAENSEPSDEIKEFLKEFPDGKEPGEIIYKIPKKSAKPEEAEEEDSDETEENENEV